MFYVSLMYAIATEKIYYIFGDRFLLNVHQWLADVFCEEPDRKYFQFCGMDHLCHNSAPVLL